MIQQRDLNYSVTPTSRRNASTSSESCELLISSPVSDKITIEASASFSASGLSSPCSLSVNELSSFSITAIASELNIGAITPSLLFSSALTSLAISSFAVVLILSLIFYFNIT
ncbi:hypothetical protein [Rickettsia endosymbiont of Gonocerus acuteangulatus]|uniref:hypothetical protein n=1 Tax=Rickettsia endosymbiont of Gonocerus acuteangulatus TaxID=3066266 RepID=UPI003132EA5C